MTRNDSRISLELDPMTSELLNDLAEKWGIQGRDGSTRD